MSKYQLGMKIDKEKNAGEYRSIDKQIQEAKRFAKLLIEFKKVMDLAVARDLHEIAANNGYVKEVIKSFGITEVPKYLLRRECLSGKKIGLEAESFSWEVPTPTFGA